LPKATRIMPWATYRPRRHVAPTCVSMCRSLSLCVNRLKMWFLATCRPKRSIRTKQIIKAGGSEVSELSIIWIRLYMGSSTKDVQPKTEFLYPPPLTKLQPFSPVRGENINAIWTSVDRGLSCVSDSEAQNILSLCMSCLWSTPPPRTWAFKLVHTPPPYPGLFLALTLVRL